MASLVKRLPSRYDVLAEALTADGRTVKRVEAQADGLADVVVPDMHPDLLRAADDVARELRTTPYLQPHYEPPQP